MPKTTTSEPIAPQNLLIAQNLNAPECKEFNAFDFKDLAFQGVLVKFIAHAETPRVNFTVKSVLCLLSLALLRAKEQFTKHYRQYSDSVDVEDLQELLADRERRPQFPEVYFTMQKEEQDWLRSHSALFHGQFETNTYTAKQVQQIQDVTRNMQTQFQKKHEEGCDEALDILADLIKQHSTFMEGVAPMPLVATSVKEQLEFMRQLFCHTESVMPLSEDIIYMEHYSESLQDRAVVFHQAFNEFIRVAKLLVEDARVIITIMEPTLPLAEIEAYFSALIAHAEKSTSRLQALHLIEYCVLSKTDYADLADEILHEDTNPFFAAMQQSLPLATDLMDATTDYEDVRHYSIYSELLPWYRDTLVFRNAGKKVGLEYGLPSELPESASKTTPASEVISLIQRSTEKHPRSPASAPLPCTTPFARRLTKSAEVIAKASRVNVDTPSAAKKLDFGNDGTGLGATVGGNANVGDGTNANANNGTNANATSSANTNSNAAPSLGQAAPGNSTALTLNFTLFSKERRRQSIDVDHQKSVGEFNRSLEAANNINELAQLAETAEAYINRHVSPMLDKIFGIKNTDTWILCMKDLRAKALTFADENLKATDLDDRKALITEWKKLDIFKSHRENSIFKGAFLRTKALQKFDDWIAENKKELRSVSAKA